MNENEEYIQQFDDEQQELELEEDMINGYIKMDYSIESSAERVKKVEEIISKTPPEKLTQRYLERLSDYIIAAAVMEDKQQKKKEIITENNLITIRKREVSFEGLVSHFENNENTGDVIYNMIANDKNIIFHHKNDISEEDIAEVPGLRSLREEIEKVEAKVKNSRGINAYNLKKQAIQMREDQYVLRNSYKPSNTSSTTNSFIKSFSKIDFNEKIKLNKDGKVTSTGFVNFYNTDSVSALLSNYIKLREENNSNSQSDAKWMLIDFKNLLDITFAETPILNDIVWMKMYEYTNIEIQKYLLNKYNTTYTNEYISCLWRNKIPKMIVEKASDEWIIWHYTFEEKGYWKKCTRCGKIKLGIGRFFCKNSSSKDKLYSICKECRNKKKEVNN